MIRMIGFVVAALILGGCAVYAEPPGVAVYAPGPGVYVGRPYYHHSYYYGHPYWHDRWQGR